VLDYLVEEVLGRQPEASRPSAAHLHPRPLCGPLCDAVFCRPARPASGQETLEYLERANLFIVPWTNERRWYRYHHLFAEICCASDCSRAAARIEYHIRASQWYEDNGLAMEAFQHAAAANDVERAERLMEGKGMPLHSRAR
jgi:LuxR family transcriptional regulator, maltose regulon positive regulatory protein